LDLPHNILLYALLLTAVAAGFFLGRKDRRRKRPQQAVITDYYHGLNFLLEDRPELGADRFIEAMEVSDATVDVHLAMASVVRRRGELEKAIRIHQNLLASPVLSQANKQLVEMELARDYHAGGLLDRAEKLLLQVIRRRGTQETAGLELLLDLYEQEREWQSAIDVSAKLVRRSDKTRVRVCHLYCELAEQALAKTDVRQALVCADKAQAMAANEARPYWILSRVELAQNNHRRALRNLQKATERSPELVGAYLAVYRSICESLQNPDEYERFLRQSLRSYPDPELLRELFELRQQDDAAETQEMLLKEIARAPSQAHLSLLLEFDLGLDLAREIKTQIGDIVRRQAGYQCENCGFTSPQVAWHCPSCRAWSSFRAAGRIKSAPTSLP